jgi:hypothetical protein
MRLWLLMIPIALSGCVADLTAPAFLSDYCRIAAPLSYDSGRDTAETIAEIEAHNSRWVCVCENDCPSKGVAN